MSEGKCRRGGTHVYPYPGKHYDDGRCLKCNQPRPAKPSRDRDLETTNVEAAAQFERNRCEP